MVAAVLRDEEEEMHGSLKLGVYRRLDNRVEGTSDDSDHALELHNRRKAALHEAFDNDPAIQVADWGDTDDSSPHEFVELVLGAAGTAALNYAIVPGIKWLGLKLADKAVDRAIAELTKAIVARLRPRQENKQLLDFTITLPDGTQIAVDPPDRDGTVTIRFADGAVESLEYSKPVQTGLS
jgi:hypothetical protein